VHVGAAIALLSEKSQGHLLEGLTMSPHEFDRDPESIPFGSISLPPDALSGHIVVQGPPGSGRAVLINQVKRHCLQRVGKGHRVFIWDASGCERQYLEPLGLNCPVDYVNPFDRWGVGIDLAAALTGPLEADGFAADVITPYSGKVNGEDGSTFQMAS